MPAGLDPHCVESSEIRNRIQKKYGIEKTV